MMADGKITIKIAPDMADLAPNYLSNRRNDLVVLKQALTQGNLDTIQKLGHKVKGTAGGYGFDGLGAIAKELDAAAKAHDITQVSNLVHQMEDYLGRVEIVVSE